MSTRSWGLSAPIADEAHCSALLAFVEERFERFASDEHHPVFALVDMVAGRIRDIKFVAQPADAGPAGARGYRADAGRRLGGAAQN